MNVRKIIVFLTAMLLSLTARATLNLQAIYTDKQGTEVRTGGNIENAEAPLHVRFESNATDLEAGASIEWHIRNEAANISLTRYEQDIEFDFTVSGTTVVTVQVMMDGEAVETASISVGIVESVLQMPNAFSPNNDGWNDKYQAKSTSKSIVEFHAYIFNRWGQKLYDWTNWSDKEAGWDGTYNGRPVKDGVYYVYVKARGADGTVYNIRRDVNLIRNYNNTEESTTNGQ